MAARISLARTAIGMPGCRVGLGVVSAALGFILACPALCLAAEDTGNTANWRRDDFSWLRGMDYTPSYAPNDVVTWRDFDSEVIDRELGYAAKLGLNSVRTWLQYIVFEHNPAKFEKDFETFLQLCEKHKLQAMPVLFDSCFGQEPAIDGNGAWVMSPGTSKEMPEYWPKIQNYVDAVVGKHVGDKRIVIWDIMNEPAIFDWTVTFVKHWAEVVHKLDPKHPITVGVAGNAPAAAAYAEIEDILSMHSYASSESQLRSEIHAMQQLGKKHHKPIIITECCAPGWGCHYEMVMPVLRDEGIGWYAWEVAIGKNQFKAISGLLYPDGTCRRKSEVAAVMNVPVETVPFAEKPDTEGIPIAPPPPPPDPEVVRQAMSQFITYSRTPTTAENVQKRVNFLLSNGPLAAPAALGDPEDSAKVIKAWGLLAYARNTLSEKDLIEHTEMLIQIVGGRLAELDSASRAASQCDEKPQE